MQHGTPAELLLQTSIQPEQIHMPSSSVITTPSTLSIFKMVPFEFGLRVVVAQQALSSPIPAIHIVYLSVW